jgi:dynactin-5
MRYVSSPLPRSSEAVSSRRGPSRPPYKTYRGAFNYYPMKIGDYVHIGANTIVEAATIGNHVEIGKNCVIVNTLAPHIFHFSPSHVCFLFLLPQGKFTIIKDCTKIADNTIIPPNTVIPALTLFAGSPGAQPGITKKKKSQPHARLI